MKTFYADNKIALHLGREGENLARQIVFDLSDWIKVYGEGTAQLLVQRPGDERPYIREITQAGATATWVITLWETEKASHSGRCELRWYVGETLVKSRTWSTQVDAALETPSEETPPDPEQGWVEQVLQAGADAQQSAANAKSYAQRAEAAAQRAENAAGGGSSGGGGDSEGGSGVPGFSPTIDVTEITGGHRLTITDVKGVETVDVMDGKEGPAGPQGPQGEKGATGPQGPQGEKGETGDTGPAGPQGEKGETGDTGPAGPQGEKGETGDAGPAGPQGEKGATGATGPQGPQGEKGETGDTGPAGPQGEKGATGDTGPQGPQGEKGEKGATGPQGPQGETGPQGPAGPQGPQGEKGAPFAVAKIYMSVEEMHAGYDTDGVEPGQFVLIDTGNVDDEDNAKLFVKGETEYNYLTDLSGAQGIQGPQGPQGIQGVQGEQGPQGEKGETGDTGPAGPQGEKGETGDIGPAGPQGEKGETGNTGPQGPQGEKGDTGPQGPQGEKGATGDTGPQGATGAAGKSAYAYAVDGGYSGSEADFAKKLAEENPTVVQTTGESTTDIMSQKAVTDAMGYPPSYWLNALETKADAIRQAMETAGKNKSAFLWYTDSHWTYGNSKVSPVLLRYLFKNTPLNKVNFGGDIVVNAQDRVNMAYLYNEWRSAIRDLPNHHSVVGNHDVMVDYPYAFLIAPEESADMVMGGDLYYYIDNPCEQTRYIYLDSGRQSISDEETAWLIATLNSTLDGWHIVVISHIWFQYTNVSAPTVGAIPSYMQKVLNLLDAYNTRGSGSITMAEVEYEYDFLTAVGAVEFCMGGHIHVDYEFTSSGGIPVILTASDVNQNRSEDETEDSGTIGTITESAVFGIIANYDSREVSVIGVGRGGSRTVALKPDAGAYINQIPISTDTDGNIYNGIGYAEDTRLNSSGAPTAATSSYAGLDCTGFIPVAVGDVVRMQNMETRPDSSLAASSRFCFYDANKAFIVMQTLNNLGAYDGVTDADGYLTQFTIPSEIISKDISAAAYMRVSVVGIASDSIITINEPIT